MSCPTVASWRSAIAASRRGPLVQGICNSVSRASSRAEAIHRRSICISAISNLMGHGDDPNPGSFILLVIVVIQGIFAPHWGTSVASSAFFVGYSVPDLPWIFLRTGPRGLAARPHLSAAIQTRTALQANCSNKAPVVSLFVVHRSAIGKKQTGIGIGAVAGPFGMPYPCRAQAA